MTNEEQVELVREKIARIIKIDCIDPSTLAEPDRPLNCPEDCGECKAVYILSIPELKILAPDQSLPHTPEWKSHKRAVEKEVLDYMLKDNWVKVI